MKIQAQVLTAFKTPLEPREFDLLPLADGEVLVKVTYAGVCGSDLHMASGQDPRTPLPIILGHEGVGEVAEIRGEKSDVEGRPLKVGQAVLWNRSVVCGRCFFCRGGEHHLCPERFVYGIHRGTGVPPHVNGCYSQYLPLDARTDVFAIDDVPPEHHKTLVTASCSGSTAAHAFDHFEPAAGETVVVQGVGPLGCFMVALARDSGAEQIVAIDLAEARLELAKRFGATLTLNINETTADDRAETVKDLTDGRGADAVYEAVGTAAVVREGLGLVRRGGRYVTAGFGQPGGAMQWDPFADLVRPDLKYVGVWVSHTRHTGRALELMKRHLADFAQMVTHTLPLAEANAAHDLMRRGEAMKVALAP
ncbi:MAG TPA: zinc-binding dehydrogenase [Phycisphaerae bacterium]|nr:zinc-binding dehydrogenase [Phycisphaerae bacterium]